MIEKQQILLSGKRPITKEKGYFHFNILNSIFSLNRFLNIDDVFLEANSVSKKTNKVDEDINVVFLPLVGNIQVNNQNISAGHILINSFSKSDTIHIANTHSHIQANYLQFCLKSEGLENGLFHFNLVTHKNQLNTLIKHSKFNLDIGLFEARQETTYCPKIKSETVFSYALQGAFEFQNMLLEDRDGAKIFDTDKNIEFEALSENALILVIEI